MRSSFFLAVQLVFGVLLSASSHAAPGDLDVSFGTEGTSITDFSSTTDVGNRMVIDSDGKIVIAGSTTKLFPADHFALVRYNSDGNLDDSFGSGGRVITGRISSDKIVFDGIRGLGLLSNGKIVACGRGSDKGTSGLAVVRYAANGDLDVTFGGDGAIIVSEKNETIVPLALVVDKEDRIIVVAVADDNFDRASFAVFRFHADGRLDETFGENGRVNTEITEGRDVPRAVQVDGEGRIVVGGFNGDHKFVVVRYQSNGEIDHSFGNNGIATIVFNDGGIDILSALAIQHDGKIIVGGDVQVGSFGGFRMVDFGLARLTSSGDLDLTFNETGKQITYFVLKASSSLWALALDSNKKIVAVGDANAVDGLGLARYNLDGKLDETFGDHGKITVPFGNTCHWGAVVLQQDGKIVTGGYVWNGKHYDIAAARFFD